MLQCVYLIVYDMYTRACSNLSVIIICIWYANCTTILAKSLTEYKNICSGKVNDLVLQSNDIVGNHHHNFHFKNFFSGSRLVYIYQFVDKGI